MHDHTLTVLEPADRHSSAANHRRHGRICCEDVECTLGTVLNISASGMLVRTGMRAPKVGSLVALQVRTFDGGFDVQAKISWSKMVGLLNREIGLEFIDLPADGKRVLLTVARAAARG